MALTRPARQLTLADALVPAAEGRAAGLLRDVALVAGGAALTAIAAQVAFRMPWTEVPYTAQTGAVLLVGTALGWRRGLLSVVLYLLVGVAGAPVFSAGNHGLGQLLGVTGGYLVGFVVAAALVGRMAELGWDRAPLRAAGLMAIGNLVIYAIGVPVLAAASGLALTDAAWRGAGVFLPWDAFKVLLAAGLLPLAWRLAGRDA